MDFEFDYTQITVTELDFHNKISDQFLCNLCIGLVTCLLVCSLRKMKT